MRSLLGRMLCLLGLHDYHIVEVDFAFGPGGGVAKLQCRRCGRKTTRPA